MPSNDRESDVRKEAPARPAKRRKQREHLNCEECRRLKLKCDRQVPCQNCLRRACADICPRGVRTKEWRGPAEFQALQDRLASVEELLRARSRDYISQDSAEDTLSESALPPPSSGMPRIPRSAERRPERHLSPIPARTDDGRHNAALPSPSASRTATSPSVAQARPHIRVDTPNPRHSGFADPPSTEEWQLPAHISHEEYPAPISFATEPPSALGNGPPLPPPVGSAISPEEHGFGTLMLSHSGASKWLGPTAGSEWLRDQEVANLETQTPAISRQPSPDRDVRTAGREAVFPFPSAFMPSRTRDIIDRLPQEEDARVLVDAFYRYYTWNYDVAPRTTVDPLFEKLYAGLRTGGSAAAPTVSHQQMALLLVIFAMGTLYNLELAPNDSSAEEYFALAKTCLAKGNFMVHNTLAGVQTLHIMGNFYLETEQGRNGDSAWPLWGLAMRLSHAMGLHRDGAKWNLPADVVEERRRCFWECYSIDVLQSNCFSRPSSINPGYIDVAFPAEPPGPGPLDGDTRGFWTLKFQLSKLSARILDLAMMVDKGPYSVVTELHQSICDFEKNLPFNFRCRAAMQAVPSSWPDPAVAVRESPEPSKKQMRIVFQRCTLAVNISETLLFLHRPFFASAIHECSSDPTRSARGQSYLAIVERCNVIIQVVSSLFSLYPAVVIRHWFFWYHVFNSAVCVGTLVLHNPQNALASFALSQIDAAIALFSSAVQMHASQRAVGNLQWLLRLRSRAFQKMSAARSGPAIREATDTEQSESDEDVELLGWRTRLIERATAGAQTAKTIQYDQGSRGGGSNMPAPSATPFTAAIQQTSLLDFSDIFGVPSSNSHASADTDQLLHEFWDPMLFAQDSTATGDTAATAHWWELGQFS